jgi:mannan endo-1,4-beta-mannosidase
MLAGGTIGIGTMVNATAGADASFSSFVERDGTSLVVDSEPYYASAANAPWLTHTYPSTETVDAVMQFASELGLDALRMGIHSVDVGGTVHSPSPGELGEAAFEHVDYVVQEAERHGIRLVFAFVDNWDYYGGMDAYVANSQTASEHDDFYTDDQCRTWYKRYVEQVLTRENTLTGRVYRDDPTILMWELANEAEAKSAGVDVLQAWKEEMAEHVKSIDSTHLLSTGSGGNYNRDSDVWEYGGGHGVDYVQNHRIPEIDVCSFHLYPEWLHENTNAYGQQWIRDHVEDAHETIGKPVFLGEFGWAAGRSPARSTVYEDWYGVLDEYDAAVAAPWQLIKEDRSETSKHDIRPSDTATTDVLAAFSALQRSKTGSSAGGGDGGSDDGSKTASSLSGETVVVEGAGADIWDRSDAFHFVHEGVGGDATFVATVSEQTNTDPWAKAGVMLRGSTAADAPHASVFVTPEHGVAFQYRDGAGGWTSTTETSGSAPVRVKVERRGDEVTGFVDRDGSWEAVGSAVVQMTDPRVGLAVTSHQTGTLSSATFEVGESTSETRSSAWTNEDVGSVSAPGSARLVGDESTSPPSIRLAGVTTESTSVTLSGELIDLGGVADASAFIEWGEADAGFTDATATTTLDAPGSFTATVDGLARSTTYVLRAVAETPDGRDTSTVVTIETDGSAPTVDDFVLADFGTTTGARYFVSWAVADADGDLASVTVALRDADGSVVDETTVDAGGANAGGTEQFTTTQSVPTIALTVRDGDGNETTATLEPEV